MYVHMGCMPMQPKFYFCASFCCCCLLFLHLYKGATQQPSDSESWHCGNRCAACRNTSEALAVLLGRSINSGDVSLNLKCPVF